MGFNSEFKGLMAISQGWASGKSVVMNAVRYSALEGK